LGLNKRRLTRIKSFFRRNAQRFMVAAFFAAIFSVLAFVSGVGFAATIEITSSQVRVRGHSCPGVPIRDCALATSSCFCVLGWEHEGVINVTFNPWFYPVNHLLGGEVSMNFTSLSKPSDSSGQLVKEGMLSQTLFSEFLVNLPYLVFIGFVVAFGIGKFFEEMRGRFRKSKRKTMMLGQ